MVSHVFCRMKEENQKIEEQLDSPICLEKCVGQVSTHYNGQEVSLDVNFYTLDVLNRDEIPRSLSRELFVVTEDEEYIRNSTRVERRTFCDFLFLKYPDDYKSVLFEDRESPDYIIHHGGRKFAFEVVEATNPKEAQFNTMCRKNTGRGKTKEQYEDYLSKKHKQLGGTFAVDEYEGGVILSPFKGMVDTCRTRNQIVDAIVKKVHKYTEYDVDCDEKNILVFYSTLGFDNEFDFEQVGNMIADIDDIGNSDISRIFVVSGLYQTLVEYDSQGNFMAFRSDNLIH